MCNIGSLVDFIDTHTHITKLNCLNLILINGPNKKEVNRSLVHSEFILLQLKRYAMYSTCPPLLHRSHPNKTPHVPKPSVYFGKLPLH